MSIRTYLILLSTATLGHRHLEETTFPKSYFPHTFLSFLILELQYSMTQTKLCVPSFNKEPLRLLPYKACGSAYLAECHKHILPLECTSQVSSVSVSEYREVDIK